MSDETLPLRRSDATRAAILAAAREQFAASGYAGATIRAIAAQAGIDPAMVMRYFGNKEGLFAAAAELDLQLPDLRQVPRRGVGEALAAHLLERWEDDEALQAMLRAAVTHDAVARRLQAVLAGQVLPMVAQLRGETRAQAASRAALVATQALGLALCRYVLRMPPVVGLKRPEVIRRVGATFQAYLLGD